MKKTRTCTKSSAGREGIYTIASHCPPELLILARGAHIVYEVPESSSHRLRAASYELRSYARNVVHAGVLTGWIPCERSASPAGMRIKCNQAHDELGL